MTKIRIERGQETNPMEVFEEGRKKENVLFNDAFNTFYMASDIW